MEENNREIHYLKIYHFTIIESCDKIVDTVMHRKLRPSIQFSGTEVLGTASLNPPAVVGNP